ncbi:hypothetical protein VTK26DRAFT_7668 [Humicola hyalothermophila]
MDLASECPIWEHLGLELRLNHVPRARPDHNTPQASYFLHHPDLSSELISPSDVPSARFQTLRCEVNYHLKLSPSETKTRSQLEVESLPLNECTSEAPSRHTYGLKSNPKRSKKAAAAQEEVDRALASPLASTHTHIESAFSDTGRLAPEVIVEELGRLLDAAFRRLVGLKKLPSGTKAVSSPPLPSLVDIAPAVWNLPYLRVRMEYRPVVFLTSANLCLDDDSPLSNHIVHRHRPCQA